MSNTLTPDTRGRLINLKTNLKSLQFGGDRPASGTSNQPYIVKDIPKGTGYLRDGMPLQSGPDFILRDGFLAPVKAIQDISRLAQMFVDIKSPRGLFFTLKQNLLSKASVKTQASYGLGYFGGAMNQGAYLPIGTLLDAGLGWAGIHLNKNGLNPVGSLGGPAGANRNAQGGAGALNPYSVVVQNSQDKTINRLVAISDYVGNNVDEISEEDSFNNTFTTTDLGGGFKYNTRFRDNPVLMEYSGGPGSILGIGKTYIFREQPTYNAIRNFKNLVLDDGLYNGAGKSSGGVTPLLVGGELANYQKNNKYFKQGGAYPRSFSNFVIEQALEGTFKQSKIIHKAPDYQRANKALRVGLGDPGRHVTYAVSGSTETRNVFNYGIDAFEMKALDKLTALKIYESGPGGDHTLPINDLVKFRIAVVKNGVSTGNKADYVHFRAYINGFTDNFAAAWSDVQYVGRGNKFKSYSGFTRDIQMGFTVMATSKAELIPMFTKLNFLASSLAPDYTSAGFMRGNMVRMTVGGYLYEVPGVLTSLTYTIPDNTTWEIAIDENGKSDKSVKELPHRIEVSLAFTPIEDFLPSRQTLGYEDGELKRMGQQRFISLNTGYSSGYVGDYGVGQYFQPNKNSEDE
jgi:hypothetical protein